MHVPISEDDCKVSASVMRSTSVTQNHDWLGSAKWFAAYQTLLSVALRISPTIQRLASKRHLSTDTMKWNILLASLLFCSLVFSACLPVSAARPTYHDHNKQVFGIEFTLDRLYASISLENGLTYALVTIPGGNAYQSLMRKYLSTCHQAHLIQAPPVAQRELEKNWYEAREKEWHRREQSTLHPDSSWSDFIALNLLNKALYSPEYFDGDAFAGDSEVGVLAAAVQALKNATLIGMRDWLNITDLSSWPFASIILPDFFWTHTKPNPDPNEYPSRVTFADIIYGDSDSFFWFHDILRKFTTALYRNKYRQEAGVDEYSISQSSDNIAHVFPASYETLRHTQKFRCDDRKQPDADLKNRTCGPETMSPTAVVVDYTNASLSLWLDGHVSGWEPWKTFPELGAHALANVSPSHLRDEAEMLGSHLLPAIQILQSLVGGRGNSKGEEVDIILSGESWSTRSRAVFKDLVSGGEEAQELTGSVNYFHQPDVFAASKRVARWGRYYVDTAFVCTLGVEEEEPWDVLSGHDEL
ncbi:hypothetical protein Q7P37_006866 [Cladosporium fusiforme]